MAMSGEGHETWRDVDIWAKTPGCITLCLMFRFKDRPPDKIQDFASGSSSSKVNEHLVRRPWYPIVTYVTKRLEDGSLFACHPRHSGVTMLESPLAFMRLSFFVQRGTLPPCAFCFVRCFLLNSGFVLFFVPIRAPAWLQFAALLALVRMDRGIVWVDGLHVGWVKGCTPLVSIRLYGYMIRK